MVKKHIKPKKIIIIFLFLILFSAKGTYAKYVKSEILNVNQRIAKPVLKIDEGEISEIDKTKNIGVYEFYIRNFENDNISEIEFLYTIEIISNLGEDVQFELYNKNQKIELNNLKTENLEIKANEKMEQKYLLKIFYNPSSNIGNEGEKECIEKIQIKINLVQQKK